MVGDISWCERAAVIGAGRAGTAFALGLGRAGVDIACVASRSPDAAARLAGAVDASVTSPVDAAARADLVVVAVPDDAVRDIAAVVADGGGWRAGNRAIHCSGVLGLDALGPAAETGVRTGICHPLRPLADPWRADVLDRVPMGVETSDGGRWVIELAEALGGRPFSLEGVSRPLYHAAACVASNHAVALAGLAGRIFEAAGVGSEDARRLTASLLTATARTLEAAPPADALTGPVVRGDAGTVRTHLVALRESDPGLARNYAALSALTLELVPPGPAHDGVAAVLEGTA